MQLAIPIFMFIGLAVGLAWYFLAHDEGQKEPIGWLWLAFGFGFLGAIAAGILEPLIIPKEVVTDPILASRGSLFVSMLTVGFIEELCKFLPFALLVYRRYFFNEHVDGVMYFGLAGLGFGLPENILYSLQFGVHVAWVRLVIDPFFHVATTAMIGYFLIKVKVDHKPFWYVVCAFVGAVLLHGVFDFGLGSGSEVLTVFSLMITLGMTTMLFVLFMRAGELDREAGLSRMSNNSFCKACGFPNPNHTLYCQRCGVHA